MIPLSAVWAGPERDEHFDAPSLFFAKTEGSTPFRFSLHVGDVGHTLIVGPTGAGKSVLLALMALQFRRYEHAQIFAFDFGGSIRAAATAMNGRRFLTYQDGTRSYFPVRQARTVKFAVRTPAERLPGGDRHDDRHGIWTHCRSGGRQSW